MNDEWTLHEAQAAILRQAAERIESRLTPKPIPDWLRDWADELCKDGNA